MDFREPAEIRAFHDVLSLVNDKEARRRKEIRLKSLTCPLGVRPLNLLRNK